MQPEEMSAREQLALVWKSKVLIGIVTFVFGAAAVAVAFILPKQYEASVVLSPVSNNMSSGGLGGNLGSMASQFGGLAALAGISVTGDSAKSESLAVLQSEYLTESFIQQNNLLPVLYAKLWDPVRKVWTTQDPLKTPTLWKANKKFDETVRKIIPNAKTGIVSMTITWRNPKQAADWANGMVQMTNEYLRDKAIHEADRNIAYLNEEAAKSNVVEVRQAIYQLMKTEINRAMIARGSKEYAFRVIDPATPPELASSPRKALWVLGGLVAGFMLALFYVLTRASLRQP
jgi:uncharacterized protein involved in exopolysaccharide biosynthesis